MRRALVTGCSRGIGRAVTEMLLAEGWDVSGVSRTRPDLTHPLFSWRQADLSEIGARFVLRGPPLNALIHCAATRGGYGAFADTPLSTLQTTVVTNLLGTMQIVHAALPRLQESADARVLLMSGGGAFDPSPGYSAYAVSKAGVVALMETLAAELAETSVTVNAVAPGFVATGIHAGTPDEGRDDGGDAMDRVLACVNYLLSPAATGLTGKTISARFDDWQSLCPWIVDQVNESTMGTRWRRPVQNLQRLLVRTIKAM